MADVELSQLIINKLTKAQYDSITPDENQLYLITDDSDNVIDQISTLVDGESIVYENEKISAQGLKTSSGTTLLAWIGTQEQYNTDYAAGSIPANMLCIVTDV